MNKGMLGFPQGGRVAFHATLSVAQSGIAAATHTKVLMNNATLNQGGFYNKTRARFCPPKGRYLLVSSIYWSAGVEANKTIFAQIWRNGVAALQVLQHTSSAGTIVSQATKIVETPGGEHFEPYVWMNPSGTSTVGIGGWTDQDPLSFFAGFEI